MQYGGVLSQPYGANLGTGRKHVPSRLIGECHYDSVVPGESRATLMRGTTVLEYRRHGK